MSPRLSVVEPCLNEAETIVDVLGALQPLRGRGTEVIVVDGGSADATATLAKPYVDRVVESTPGRAVQMNAGAAAASGKILLFLHADTRLPSDADEMIAGGLARRNAAWGRFDVSITGTHPMLGIVSASMNLRSRLTGIATGDQAIFVRRSEFDAVGRYREIALMEDIELSARLKRRSPPLCLREKVLTSGRRWERNGVARTILLMWHLRLRFWLGSDPAALALLYERGK